MTIADILGNVFLILGSVFLFSAGLGVLRMPDIYNRIQTGTKATTLGTILILIGLAIIHPAWAWKLVILIFFIMMTNPVSSHALARAAHTSGAHESSRTVVDVLEEPDQEMVRQSVGDNADD